MGRWRAGLAALLAVAGAAHLAAPHLFVPIVPGWAGDARHVVYASGAAELLGAALVAHPRTRRAGGWYAAVLFIAVWPANVKMALDAGGHGPAYQVGVWARLPLQLPLIWWAVRVARTAGNTAEPQPGHVPR